MTRYYYTDPLAAAWMARHHGMNLYLGNLENGDFDAYGPRRPHMLVEDWEYRNNPNTFLEPVSRVYIHPDSLRLLEPQVGDKLEYGDCDPKHVLTVWSDKDFRAGAHKISESYAVELHDNGTLGRIIQRNGVAFHWPEKEAA